MIDISIKRLVTGNHFSRGNKFIFIDYDQNTLLKSFKYKTNIKIYHYFALMHRFENASNDFKFSS